MPFFCILIKFLDMITGKRGMVSPILVEYC